MEEERCDVCGEAVPHDKILSKGRLRCCPQCAQPPIVADEPDAAHPSESGSMERDVRRFGAAADRIDEYYPVDGVTLRMRVATLGSQ